MNPKGKLLLVDDDGNILTVLKQLFDKSNYEVRTATNTIGAGYLLKDFDPDLVVLDIMLAGSTTGDQICHSLREIKPGIKIIFHSGVDETRLRHMAREQSADAVVPKGSRPKELLRVVDELIGK